MLNSKMHSLLPISLSTIFRNVSTKLIKLIFSCNYLVEVFYNLLIYPSYSLLFYCHVPLRKGTIVVYKKF